MDDRFNFEFSILWRLGRRGFISHDFIRKYITFFLCYPVQLSSQWPSSSNLATASSDLQINCNPTSSPPFTRSKFSSLTSLQLFIFSTLLLPHLKIGATRT